MKSLSRSEIQKYIVQFRALSNAAKFSEVHKRAKSLAKKYPDVIEFAYYEAVYYAEDDVSYSPAEVARRYRITSKMLLKLLRRLNGIDEHMRLRIRNEYYWFSKQPAKQYRLGIEAVALGYKESSYSTGVGAAEMARRYALTGRSTLSLLWATRSEKAWKAYFRIIPDWFNSYLFYAMALGLQRRDKEMNLALERARKIAKKPTSWIVLAKVRSDVSEALSAINRSSSKA